MQKNMARTPVRNLRGCAGGRAGERTALAGGRRGRNARKLRRRPRTRARYSPRGNFFFQAPLHSTYLSISLFFFGVWARVRILTTTHCLAKQLQYHAKQNNKRNKVMQNEKRKQKKKKNEKDTKEQGAGKGSEIREKRKKAKKCEKQETTTLSLETFFLYCNSAALSFWRH